MPILVVREFNLTALHSGLALSVAAGVAALTAFQAGWVSRLVSEEIRVLAGFVLSGVSYILAALAGNYPFVLVCMAVWGLGFGTLMATLNAAAAGLVSNELRAGVLSIFTLLIYLGQTVSPPFFALFVTEQAVGGVFIAGSAIALIRLLFTVYVAIRARRKTETCSGSE